MLSSLEFIYFLQFMSLITYRPITSMLVQPVIDSSTGQVLAAILVVNKREKNNDSDLFYEEQFNESDWWVSTSSLCCFEAWTSFFLLQTLTFLWLEDYPALSGFLVCFIKVLNLICRQSLLRSDSCALFALELADILGARSLEVALACALSIVRDDGVNARSLSGSGSEYSNRSSSQVQIQAQLISLYFPDGTDQFRCANLDIYGSTSIVHLCFLFPDMLLMHA